MTSLIAPFLALALTATWAPAFAADEKPANPAPGVRAGELRTVTATVEAIDLPNRDVTLRGPRGNLFTVHVDDRVKNLPQVKVGDKVVARYYEGVAIRLGTPGEAPSAMIREEKATAQPGERPAGVVARQLTVSATVDAIDKATSTVRLKGPQGKALEVKVQDPQVLDKLKVGDSVEATYTEAVAVAVEPPATR